MTEPPSPAPATPAPASRADRRTIVHVVRSLDRGGVETWLMNVLRRIDPARFAVVIVTLSQRPGALDDAARACGARIVRCPRRRGLAAFARSFARSFAEVIREVECSVVHSHVLFFSGHVLRIAHRAGVPIRIAHAHNTSDGRPDSWRRRGYRAVMRRAIRRHATHLIAVSSPAGRYLLPERARSGPERCLMPCGVDPDQFRSVADRDELCRALGIPVGARVIGHVGSFSLQKNHGFLLEVLRTLSRRRGDVVAVLVGDGPLRGDIERRARESGPSPHVVFAGARDDVPILMRNVFDVFVLPSRFEGLPVVVVEAQCAGVPVIVSECVTREVVAVPDLVTFESLDTGPDAWADRIDEVLNRGPSDRSAAPDAIAGTRFDVSAGVARLARLYSG